MFAAFLLLTVLWVAMTGEASLVNLLVGCVVALAVLALGRQRVRFSLRRIAALPRALALLVYFLVEMVVANLRVAALVLHPRPDIHPEIVAVPLDVEEDWEITLLAQLITLTPGTMPVDLSADHRTLYVHFLRVYDEEEARRSIKDGFEARIRRLTR